MSTFMLADWTGFTKWAGWVGMTSFADWPDQFGWPK